MTDRRAKNEGTIRLHPIKRLRRVSRKEISRAVKHFERRAKAGAMAAELARLQRLETQEEESSWTDVDSVKETLKLCHAIYESGRFTLEEYFFHSALPVERLHEHRQFIGDYDDKLGPISKKIREIEALYGLRDGQYWPRGTGPTEYQRQNARYDQVLRLKLGSLFRELGLFTHARLWLKDRAEFDRLREAGRASVSEAEDLENATAKLINMYESEAKKCANAKAYYAACVMLGSASEALILLKCLQEPESRDAALSRIPKSRGFHKGGPQFWNLHQLVEIASEAGWIANLETENVLVYIVNLMAHLHGLRNLLHPGHHARQKPHISIGKEQYQDARSAYLALRYALEKTSGQSASDANTPKGQHCTIGISAPGSSPAR